MPSEAPVPDLGRGHPFLLPRLQSGRARSQSAFLTYHQSVPPLLPLPLLPSVPTRPRRRLVSWRRVIGTLHISHDAESSAELRKE